MTLTDQSIRLKKLRLAKLSAESERDKYRRRFKASRYRLRLARIALHAHPLTIRNRIHRYANLYLKGRIRIGELLKRIDEMEKDYDKLLDMVGKFKDSQALHRCPKCGEPRRFNEFPRDPAKILGRCMSRCNVCQSARLGPINRIAKMRRQSCERDEEDEG